MDNTTGFSLFSILIMGGACFFFLLVMAGMGFVFFRFFKRRSDTFQEIGKELADKKEHYFNKIDSRLLTWDENALGDFASLLEITGRSALGSLRYSGTIKSMTQPENFAWLAFDLQLKFGKGRMELRTSKANYELDININKVSEIRVDGIPFGKISPNGKRLSLLGVDGRPSGYYDHLASNMKVVLSEKPYYLRSGYYAPSYSPVIIHNRQVAEFNNKLMLSQHREFVKEKVLPLYQHLSPNINSEERDWMIALLGLEIWYRIGRHINGR